MFVLLLFSLMPMALSGCPPGAYDLSAFGKCAVLEKTGQDFGYFEAELTCQDMGGHLMSIQNGFENSILNAFAAGANIAGGIYIGADKHKKDNWTWTDGSSLNYTNWAAGNPKEGKQCAVLHVNDGKWYSEDCAQSIPYFCEVPEKEVPVCPPEWTIYNNSCYYKQVNSTQYTWNEARSICLQLGGDLASIHSAEENDFVAAFTSSSNCSMGWIGLHYNVTYSWTDATPVTFRNIASEDKPGGYAIYPTCGMNPALFGLWFGYPGYTWGTFICKRPANIGLVNVSQTKQENKKTASATKSVKVEGSNRVRTKMETY